MKFLKYALAAAAILVVLAVSGIAYVAATFDPNQYKGRIVAAAKEHTQRDLDLVS